MKRVTSASNPDYKRLMKLAQSARERRRAGLCVLDGVHLVQSYRAHVGDPQQVVVATSARADQEIINIIKGLNDALVLELSDALIRPLSGVATPTGIAAIVRTPQPATAPRNPGPCVLLQDVQDPGNLGSILRSTAAAGVREVYLSRGCAQCWSPRVLRAGMGAHFMLDLFENTDLVAFAQGYPGRVFAASRTANRSVHDTDLTGLVALAFGNEGAGISDDLAAAAGNGITIPMPGPTESLNVAAAAAVCLFERVRQMG